jgi:hypothetical protein
MNGTGKTAEIAELAGLAGLAELKLKTAELQSERGERNWEIGN